MIQSALDLSSTGSNDHENGHEATMERIRCHSPDTTFLDLSSNQHPLSLLPIEIYDYTKLKGLFLQANQLSAIPDRLFTDLPHLTHLDLRNNCITHIPEIISIHRNLHTLLLQSNLVTKLPIELGDVRTLKALSLSDNPLVFPNIEIVEGGVQTVLQFLRTQSELVLARKQLEHPASNETPHTPHTPQPNSNASTIVRNSPHCNSPTKPTIMNEDAIAVENNSFAKRPTPVKKSTRAKSSPVKGTLPSTIIQQSPKIQVRENEFPTKINNDLSDPKQQQQQQQHQQQQQQQQQQQPRCNLSQPLSSHSRSHENFKQPQQQQPLLQPATVSTVFYQAHLTEETKRRLAVNYEMRSQ